MNTKQQIISQCVKYNNDKLNREEVKILHQLFENKIEYCRMKNIIERYFVETESTITKQLDTCLRIFNETEKLLLPVPQWNEFYDNKPKRTVFSIQEFELQETEVDEVVTIQFNPEWVTEGDDSDVRLKRIKTAVKSMGVTEIYRGSNILPNGVRVYVLQIRWKDTNEERKSNDVDFKGFVKPLTELYFKRLENREAVRAYLYKCKINKKINYNL